MSNKYSYDNVGKILFTDEDIETAKELLDGSDLRKTIATLTADDLSGKALSVFGDLAGALNGRVYKQYGTLEIQVPKLASEVIDSALYQLRYSLKHEALRDQRAFDQGIAPVQEEVKKS